MLCQIGIYRDDIVSGHGFIALAIVILGRWNPFVAVIAAFGFGAADALPISLQMLNLDIPPQALLALPYVIAVLAMPPALLFLYMLVNDREIMGVLVSPLWANVLALGVVIVLIGAGLMFGVSVIAPNALALVGGR